MDLVDYVDTEKIHLRGRVHSVHNVHSVHCHDLRGRTLWGEAHGKQRWPNVGRLGVSVV